MYNAPLAIYVIVLPLFMVTVQLGSSFFRASDRRSLCTFLLTSNFTTFQQPELEHSGCYLLSLPRTLDGSMVRSHAGRGALLSSNLPQLQNLIKRDPPAYKEEFLQQWNHYKSILNIFQANPVEQSEQFRDVITFISQVCFCYVS